MQRLIFLLMVLFGTVALAEERILDFHSDIRVLKDGSMQVSETITVNAEGNKIKRGIYRDFPTHYKDRLGNNYNVGFSIISVERDGITESFRTENQSNGIRIYIGKKNEIIPTGTHIYRLQYHTNRQLGFFENYDELYWNVTGNDWDFTIEEASATVHLPEDIPSGAITSTAYTGPSGSKARNYTTEIESGARIQTKTTQSLPPRTGLTIAVGWPKGYVVEPTARKKLQYLLEDNSHLITALIGLIVVIAYYLLMWLRVGKDPEAGIIIPLYEPPFGYSPAAMRYIEKMKYDSICFAAAIVNLAVKGYLTIIQKDKDFVLQRTEKNHIEMAAGEAALANKLFDGKKKLTLKQSNHQKIRAAMKAQTTSLKANYEKLYFITNTAYFIGGIAVTLVVLIAILLSLSSQVSAEALFLVVWLTFWSVGVFALIKAIVLSWQKVSQSPLSFVPAIFITLFAIPFFGAEIFVFIQIGQMVSFSLILIMTIIIVVNWLFYELLKAPTRAGRQLLDKTGGFREFIELAEKQDLEHKHPVGRTPELFEAYLPYAIALGVEQQWGEHFSDVLKQASLDGNAYSPGWYQGHHWNNTNISAFTSSIGSSLSSAIASSSTAPGSSSGGGGGGSSGGGGGGGGGGGW